MNEFELIRRFFQRECTDVSVRRGVGDDAAVVTPAAGRDLVMTTDTQVVNRHFPADLPVADIGWRSLAVNLSDLAAMGAEPRWCLLTLSLPAGDEHWLEAFCEGFNELAGVSGMQLVGGDLVRGELAITVQAVGDIPAGQALGRDGARPGDRLCISGVPGEAAAGLAQWRTGVRSGPLVRRLARPEPALALGSALRGTASACIDISDGLLADLGHILEASDCGAQLDARLLPVSRDLREWRDAEQILRVQLGGGDDYLLLFTLPDDVEVPEGCTVIGRIRAGRGLQVLDLSGRPMADLPAGFDHFAGEE